MEDYLQWYGLRNRNGKTISLIESGSQTKLLLIGVATDVYRKCYDFCHRDWKKSKW